MARCSIRMMMKIVAWTAVCLAIIVPIARWTAAARDLGRQAGCESNMHNAALGLMSYLNVRASFPRGTIANPNLLPGDRVSFYAEVSPYFEYSGLYNAIDQTQPWTGSSNASIAVVRVGILLCPSSDRVSEPAPQPTTTLGIAGLGADAPSLLNSDPRAGIFGYDRQTTLADIKDGTANTMMLAESARGIGCWLQGGPATVRGLDPANQPYIGPGRQFGGLHDRGAVIAMADGSVRFVSDSVNPKVFEALSTIAGGERLPAGWNE
jgi:prepilin-type processing-associated H-X9-DG protein